MDIASWEVHVRNAEENDLLRREKGGYFKKASWLNDSGANFVHFIRSNPNWEIRSNFEPMGNSWNFLLVLAIHELGHVVFGVIGGLTFKFMTVGPITIQKKRKITHSRK